MKTTACLPPRERTAAVCCRVAAHACLRVAPEGLVALRREPGPQAKDLLSASFLKHAEEQSVVGIAAVLHAIAGAGWGVTGYTDWGVVAAANFLGRAGTAQTVQRYVQEGAWGISPHLIPHQSLHAVSGTISQALKVYGPNIGVGGGPNSGPDAFLIAATFMSDQRVPGLWLVLTGHEAESIPPQAGQPAPTLPAICAAAMALVPEPAGPSDGLFLHMGVNDGTLLAEAEMTEFSLGSLVATLGQIEQPPAGRWCLGTSAWVELEAVTVGETLP